MTPGWLMPQVQLPAGKVRTVRPLDMRGAGLPEGQITSEQPETVAERAPDRAPMPETKPSPARPAAQPEDPMKDKKPLLERALDALKQHGPCTTEQLAKHTDTTVANLYNVLGPLQAKHGVVKHREGIAPATYAIGGKPALKASKRAKSKAPSKRQPVQKAPAPKGQNGNGHAAFAINENGELGITKEGQKLSLDGMEFARLRGFIDRTEPVWKVA